MGKRKNNIRWTEDKIALLHREYQTQGLTAVAQKLEIHKTSVFNKARVLGLTLPRGRNWDSISDDWLREEYLTKKRKAQDIAQELGKPLAQVTAKLYRIGLRKNTKWTAEMEAQLQNCESGRQLADKLQLPIEIVQRKIYNTKKKK